jgi:hypothetical protein
MVTVESLSGTVRGVILESGSIFAVVCAQFMTGCAHGTANLVFTAAKPLKSAEAPLRVPWNSFAKTGTVIRIRNMAFKQYFMAKLAKLTLWNPDRYRFGAFEVVVRVMVMAKFPDPKPGLP